MPNTGRDESGDLNDGVLEGPIQVPGRVRYGLQFNAVGDTVTVPNSNSLRLTDKLSIAAWVKGDLSGSYFSGHTIGRKGSMYYLSVSDNRVYGRVLTNGKFRAVRGTTWLNNNEWYHLAMTFDKDEAGTPAGIDTFDGFRADTLNSHIPLGSAGSWDPNQREIGNVLYDPEDPDPSRAFKATYSGHPSPYVQNQVWVGWATSPDGITWTKQGKLSEIPLEDPYVVKVAGVYYLFAENKEIHPQLNIRRFHSTDFVNWVDDGVVLAKRTGGIPYNWEVQDVSSPIVWVENGVWYLYYEARGSAQAGAIGLATSTDGLNFARLDSPIVRPGAGANDWDNMSIIPDDLIKVGGVYYMFYHGTAFNPNGVVRSGTFTGMLISTDLVNWTRYALNPVDTHDTVMILNLNDQPIFFATDAAVGISRYFPRHVNAPHLFVNGVEETYLQRQDAENRTITTDSAIFSIGRAPSGSDLQPFSGIIDEVRVYSRVLAPSEIVTLAQMSEPVDPPPPPPPPDFVRGDLNCDHQLNNFDIDDFVLLLLDQPQYQLTHPGCNIAQADMNIDGHIDNFDIDPFVECLLAGGCP